jgi:hypothetical protein
MGSSSPAKERIEEYWATSNSKWIMWVIDSSSNSQWIADHVGDGFLLFRPLARRQSRHNFSEILDQASIIFCLYL